MATSKHSEIPSDQTTPRSSLDETVHKHLSDQHHHITDQEIKNVVPGELTLRPNADGSAADPLAAKDDQLNNEISGDRKTNAWDVLGDGK